MSHSLSYQVHSTKAACASNVSPLHHSGSTTVKVALAENSEKIVTREDFEMLLEQIEVWEKASS
ncbi:TPA: hypothetical protein P0E30_001452 [Vibrio harveyi]|uniref:hypothetical protein n=1 Tax=Vibrio harveyi TaxID=669 RepID=UPI002119E089|nr:hypothetical protein [Vibrio harveyi]MCQ9073194.1 hypothetical protein [Vibrio harveyi]HDM8190052.1 hypothetical protein [Vibrio harveyi]